MKRIKLIEDWRNAWRFWSLRLGMLGTLITGTLIAAPDIALSAWQVMPEDIKQHMPQQYMPMCGVALFVLAMLARVLKQKDL